MKGSQGEIKYSESIPELNNTSNQPSSARITRPPQFQGPIVDDIKGGHTGNQTVRFLRTIEVIVVIRLLRHLIEKPRHQLVKFLGIIAIFPVVIFEGPDDGVAFGHHPLHPVGEIDIYSERAQKQDKGDHGRGNGLAGIAGQEAYHPADADKKEDLHGHKRHIKNRGEGNDKKTECQKKREGPFDAKLFLDGLEGKPLFFQFLF